MSAQFERFDQSNVASSGQVSDSLLCHISDSNWELVTTQHVGGMEAVPKSWLAEVRKLKVSNQTTKPSELHIVAKQRTTDVDWTDFAGTVDQLLDLPAFQ